MDYLDTNKIASILNITPQAVRRRGLKECWGFRTRKARGGGREWHVQTLPEAIQNLVTCYLKDIKQQQLDRITCSSIDKTNKGFQDTIPVSSPTGITTKQQLRAESRSMVVRIFTAWCEAGNLKLSTAREMFCHLYNDDAEKNLQVPEWVTENISHLSAKSLFNWEKTLKSEGMSGLSGAYGTHRKGSGKIDCNDDMKDLIVALIHKHPHTSVRNIMRGLEARFSRNELPSRRTLARWVTTYREQNQAVLLKNANPDGWRSKHQAAVGSASSHIIRLNQVWEYDSTIADVMLADGKRHAIIGIIDVWSRRVKFLVSRTSKTSAIKALTRQCILDWGIPEVAKTDNGKDYTSHELDRCLSWLGIHHDLCPPFSPEKKPHIERVFKTFLHGVFELLEDYVGHNVVDRKAIESRKSFAARLRHKEHQDKPVSLGLTPEKLQEFCDHWTQNMYEREFHDSLKMSPFEKAISWRKGVRKLEDERPLDVLLSPAPSNQGWRTVTKKGVKVGGYIYAHPALFIESEVPAGRVQVLLDETDAGYVYCFTENSQFVCRAMCPDVLGIDPEQLARACSIAQKQYNAEETKKLKAAAKRAKVDTILSDIIAHAADNAGKVCALPHRSEGYETPALTESGKAIAAMNMPEHQVSQATLELQQRLMNLAESKKVSSIEPSFQKRDMQEREGRYAKYKDIELRLEQGKPVSDEEIQWLTSYRVHPECRALEDREKHMKEFEASLKKEIPAAQNE